jgi:hypothetical protein
MTDDDLDMQIECATYTHARRHPMVLGNIGGWTPPFQLTLVQAAVVLVTLGLEAKTYSWWSGAMPPVAAAVAALGFPCVLAWAVRRTRIEGRSLPRLALGWIQYAAAPRRGTVSGRAYQPGRPARPLAAPIFVAPARAER